MKTFEYTITDELGIHARPAGMLVKEASKFASKIMIASPKKEVDAKRIMGVMSMGAKKGDTVKLTVSGIDDTASIIWISGNSNAVTVSDGEVTAIGVGKAVVYAIQGSNVLTCNIEVEPLKVTIYGDANFDDKLDISDAVMILQAIANPQKYGTNGYDQNHLTLQGEVNSDCYRPGTGMTSMDALAIQKSVLGLVTLPQES